MLQHNRNRTGTSVRSLNPTTMQGGVACVIKITRRPGWECLNGSLLVSGLDKSGRLIKSIAYDIRMVVVFGIIH